MGRATLLDSILVPIYRYLMGSGQDLTRAVATAVLPDPSGPIRATVEKRARAIVLALSGTGGFGLSLGAIEDILIVQQAKLVPGFHRYIHRTI